MIQSENGHNVSFHLSQGITLATGYPRDCSESGAYLTQRNSGASQRVFFKSYDAFMLMR